MEIILHLDVISDSRALVPAEVELRRVLKRKLLGLCSLEWMIARQKSRLLHLKEGEENTLVFHQHVLHRQRKNVIMSLRQDRVLGVARR